MLRDTLTLSTSTFGFITISHVNIDPKIIPLNLKVVNDILYMKVPFS